MRSLLIMLESNKKTNHHWKPFSKQPNNKIIIKTIISEVAHLTGIFIKKSTEKWGWGVLKPSSNISWVQPVPRLMAQQAVKYYKLTKRKWK